MEILFALARDTVTCLWLFEIGALLLGFKMSKSIAIKLSFVIK